MRTRALAATLALLPAASFLPLTGANAAPSHWLVEACAGYLSDGPMISAGGPGFGNYEALQGSGLPLLAVGRRTGHVTILSEAGYFRLSERPGCYPLLDGGPGGCPAAEHAYFIPVSVGARYQTFTTRERHGGPYFELLPTAFAMRWAIDQAGVTKIVPGVQAGLGVRFTFGTLVGLDAGVRYVRSATFKTGEEWYAFDQPLFYTGIAIGSSAD